MKITVYSSIGNIAAYKRGVPILCYPSRQGNPHEAEFTVDLNRVEVMTNQTGFYISKKLSLFKRIIVKFRRKRVAKK